MDKEKTIKATQQWLEKVVIDLNLCPFAQRELLNNSIRFTASEAENEEQLLFDLDIELDFLVENEKVETTLLVHPKVLNDFLEYNDFLHLVDSLIKQKELEGVFQVASFHPEYQFAETEPSDVENYTNRSPYPTLHLIREASLEVAIENHPDVDSIPVTNKKLMQEMGIDKIKSLLQSCMG